jgi:hypothetical protein
MITVTYTCYHCGTTSKLPEGQLPQGWTMPPRGRDTEPVSTQAPEKYSVIALCSESCLKGYEQQLLDEKVNGKA